jgi:hypothetical protein
MQLSTEDFRSLVDSVRSLGGRVGDKRRHARQGADANVTILPLNAGGTPMAMQVGVRDVSRHGIGIRYPKSIPVGQEFILCLSQEGGEYTRTVVCVVRRIKPLSSGKFEMGCEFASEVQPPMPSDKVLKGLKKFQMKMFAADLEMA